MGAAIVRQPAGLLNFLSITYHAREPPFSAKQNGLVASQISPKELWRWTPRTGTTFTRLSRKSHDNAIELANAHSASQCKPPTRPKSKPLAGLIPDCRGPRPKTLRIEDKVHTGTSTLTPYNLLCTGTTFRTEPSRIFFHLFLRHHRNEWSFINSVTRWCRLNLRSSVFLIYLELSRVRNVVVVIKFNIKI